MARPSSNNDEADLYDVFVSSDRSIKRGATYFRVFDQVLQLRIVPLFFVLLMQASIIEKVHFPVSGCQFILGAVNEIKSDDCENDDGMNGARFKSIEITDGTADVAENGQCPFAQ